MKPQTDRFANLPENEDLTLYMTEATVIKAMPHSLILFADGKLCYIIRRVDRTKKGIRIVMDDMCPLAERLTDDKYKGTYELIMRRILFYVYKQDLIKL